MDIQKVGSVEFGNALNAVERTSSASPAGKGSTFSEVLTDMLQNVNKDQVEADHSIKELVAGKTKNIHETLLSVERADSSLKLMMQVRNKVLEAYKEIMRMQV